MRVVILKETDYEPIAGDSPACFGQLRKRVSKITQEIDGPDGTKIQKELPGPMVHFFRVGACPDLRPEVAQRLIADGAAKAFDGESVTFVSKSEILDGMPIQ